MISRILLSRSYLTFSKVTFTLTTPTFVATFIATCAVAFIATLPLAAPALAAVDVRDFSSEAERQRYLLFIEELRCPKCQNQNLAGSDAPIAKDLRRELYRLLQEGKTDGEIADFMVERYGDYVLYRPRLQQNTLVLWGLPLVLVLVGALVFTMILRRRRVRGAAAGAEPEMAALTAQEKRQLDQLLGDEEDGGQGSATGSGAPQKGQPS